MTLSLSVPDILVARAETGDLEALEALYRAFETPEELEAERKKAEASGRSYRYSGAGREIAAEESERLRRHFVEQAEKFFRPEFINRLDDMIVSGGENVHPLEVEDVLARHAGVREVAAEHGATLVDLEPVLEPLISALDRSIDEALKQAGHETVFNRASPSTREW
mgnify:CR=1 FL=1